MILMLCAKAVASQSRRATPLRLMEFPDMNDLQK
jgi:hypothetical protein